MFIGMDKRQSRCQRRSLQFSLAALLLAIGVIALCSGLLRSLYVGMSHEELARFHFGQERTIVLYAEGSTFYDPPGFLYYEVWDRARLKVPERRFQPIGPERKPNGTFQTVTSRDGNVAAVTSGDNVVIMHDFASNRTWPKEYGLDEASFLLGQELLAKLKDQKPGLQCEELDQYASVRNR